MPLQIAAAEAFGIVLGLVGAGLGIGGIAAGNEGTAAIQARLNDLERQLNDVERKIDATLDANLAEAAALSTTAVNQLRRFQDEQDAAARAAIGRDAMSDATEALDAVSARIAATKDAGLTLDQLAQQFATLSYSITAVQAVATVVENGPLGARGLHEQVKRAMDLLINTNQFFNNDSGPGDSIIGSIEDIFISSFTTSATIQSLFPPTYTYSVASPLGGEFGFVTVRSVTVPAEELTSASRQAQRDLIEALKAEYGITGMQNIVRDASQFLAQTPDNVENTYEYSLTGGDDVQTGTSKSDFMDGRRGDDNLRGEGGPDAVLGSDGNDILFGGALNDVLNGGAGNDFLIGGSNIFEAGTDDTARYEGLSDDFSIIGGTSYAIVTNLLDGSRDKLFGIDNLRFDDRLVELGNGSALDGAGAPGDFVTAERVALLYEAALNRDGNIDLPGLNFYIDVTERDNLSDEFLAQDLMTSPEFTASFGDANTLSNSDFLEQIYLNVLDRPSDAAGRQFYLDLLDDGTITKALALADIAISPENTTESVEVLMRRYENSAGEWSFV